MLLAIIHAEMERREFVLADYDRHLQNSEGTLVNRTDTLNHREGSLEVHSTLSQLI